MCFKFHTFYDVNFQLYIGINIKEIFTYSMKNAHAFLWINLKNYIIIWNLDHLKWKTGEKN